MHVEKLRLMNNAYEVFELEASEEKANSLGLAGQRLELELARLRDFDCARQGDAADRDRLVWRLAELTMNLIVQQEACGLRGSVDDVIQFYSVPREVVVRLGVRPPPALGLRECFGSTTTPR